MNVGITEVTPLSDIIIPQATDNDADDVQCALSVAEACWGRGDGQDALKWLRRASQAAAELDDMARAIALSKAVADLSARLIQQDEPPKPIPLVETVSVEEIAAAPPSPPPPRKRAPKAPTPKTPAVVPAPRQSDRPPSSRRSTEQRRELQRLRAEQRRAEQQAKVEKRRLERLEREAARRDERRRREEDRALRRCEAEQARLRELQEKRVLVSEDAPRSRRHLAAVPTPVPPPMDEAPSMVEAPAGPNQTITMQRYDDEQTRPRMRAPSEEELAATPTPDFELSPLVDQDIDPPTMVRHLRELSHTDPMVAVPEPKQSETRASYHELEPYEEPATERTPAGGPALSATRIAVFPGTSGRPEVVFLPPGAPPPPGSAVAMIVPISGDDAALLAAMVRVFERAG